MQHLYYLLTLILIISSCSDPEAKMEEESANCFATNLAENNVNLDSLIESIEQNLISEGQLKGNDGSDYVAFLKKMVSEERTSHLAAHPSTAILMELHNLPMFEDCGSRFEHDAYAGSKSEKLDKAMAEIALSMNITVKSFSNVFLNSVEESDFTKPYFKAIFWKTYADLFIAGPDLSTLLPFKVDDKEKLPYSNCPKATISITENDSIFWNERELNIETLHDSVIFFIEKSVKQSERIVEIEGLSMEKASDYLIYIETKASTSYGLYIEIQNVIINCVNELRNITSQRIFQVEYSDLNTEKSKQIESIIQKTVIEK